MGMLLNSHMVASAAPVAFVYESEAQTFFSAASGAGVDPSSVRKLAYNRLIKRLKGYGVWNKVTHLWILAADNETIAKINVRTPGTNDLTKQGTPIFTQNEGWAGTNGSPSDYLDTGIALNSLSQNNISFGIYTKVNASNTGSEIGAVDGAFNGISINPFNAAVSTASGRCMSAAVNLGSTGDVPSDNISFVALSRNGSSSFSCNKYGYNWSTTSTVSAAPNNATSVTICKANGGNSGGRRISMAFISPYLTETELRGLYSATHDFVEAVSSGEFYYEDAGIGLSSISADVIVYGATSGAITAAYQAARSGKSVAIIGGWRDRRIGGMSSAGLGFTDFDNHSSLGALPRWLITKMNSIYGRADTTFYFEPRMFSRAIRTLLDSGKNGGFVIPIYYTNGVVSVSKSGALISSIKTKDGRTVTGSRWIDASYEGDLAKLAGVTMTKGREAAGTGKESLNGFRGLITTDKGNNHQFKVGSTLVNVDPYNTPGNSGSGLLPGLSRDISACPSNGASDDQIQAYNFRLAFTDNAAFRIPLPSTPPVGYSASYFEPLGRLMQSNPTITFYDLLKVDSLGTSNCYDINSKNGWSTDLWGGSKLYPDSSYSIRETIWKDHWNRILGLFYYLQYDPDSRVLAGVRSTALAYGFHSLHYPDHHENDVFFTTPQLYVREAWRMTSDFIMNANDLSATDGTTPRSTKTIATASYSMDSHSTEALSDHNSGNPRIWLTGNFESSAGGVNLTTPVPYEVIVPKSSECTNLFVTFAISATHAAFGSIRMEYTHMMISQAAGLAAAHSINDGVTVQNVNYTNLRTALLASPTLSGEVAPVLPQLN